MPQKRYRPEEIIAMPGGPRPAAASIAGLAFASTHPPADLARVLGAAAGPVGT